MADKVDPFLSFWKQLSIDDRKKCLETFTIEPKASSTAAPPDVSCPKDVFEKISLLCSFSELYYYPTIHWCLDEPPDEDTYWVGMYHANAEDRDYLAYHYLNKAAEGSYYVGLLNTTARASSLNRKDEFELRIFKGLRRLQAQTNELWGAVDATPTNPFAPDAESLQTSLESQQIEHQDAEMMEFFRAIDASRKCLFGGEDNPSSSMWDDENNDKVSMVNLWKMWNSFSACQQHLLLPTLEQSSQRDEITKPGPRIRDWPEPKVRFADYKESEIAESKDIPSEITLTITLERSCTYIYPLVNVKEEVSKPNAWMGIYRDQSDACFDPDNYIQKRYVGRGFQGTSYHNYIKEEDLDGHVDTLYLGVIFDDKTQLGYAATKFEVAITTTPSLPQGSIQSEFDVAKALYYAQLSNLVYEPYSEVKKKLSEYNLTAEMEIYDEESDTNGFVASNDKSVVVAFRGTESFTDFLTNAKFRTIQIDESRKTFAHRGFVRSLNAVYPAIEKKLLPSIGKKELIFTGHSLGGALATLASYRFCQKFAAAHPKQYVFGCPPVGDIDLSNYFKGMDSNTITIKDDPVSSGPLLSMGSWVGLYKPAEVKYLPHDAGHSILNYIKQLEQMLKM